MAAVFIRLLKNGKQNLLFFLDSGCKNKARSFLSPPTPTSKDFGAVPTFKKNKNKKQKTAAVVLGLHNPLPSSFFWACPVGMVQNCINPPTAKDNTYPAPTSQSSSVAETGGACVYACVWVATGARCHSPFHWPLQMTLGSLSLKIQVSTVILEV